MNILVFASEYLLWMETHTTDKDLIFFFFQAEDGIRDVAVTGVQTCALPIFGDQQRALVPDDSEWVLKPYRRRPGSIAVTELEEAFTDDRADHALGRRLDHPDRARLAVGHIEPHAVRGESARLVHRRLLPQPVLERLTPGARMRADAIASEHHRPELMSPGHGDV